MKLSDQIADENPEALTADGFDDAIVGLARRCGQPTLVAYSYAKAVNVLMERDGMSYEDAVEWMEFNVVGAWMGPNTPIWIDDLVLQGALEDEADARLLAEAADDPDQTSVPLDEFKRRLKLEE